METGFKSSINFGWCPDKPSSIKGAASLWWSKRGLKCCRLCRVGHFCCTGLMVTRCGGCRCGAVRPKQRCPQNTGLIPLNSRSSGLCVTGSGYEQSCRAAVNGSNPVIAGYAELARRLLEDSGRSCDYFTVLRHPIDRLVSAFFYCPAGDPQKRPKKWWVALWDMALLS